MELILKFLLAVNNCCVKIWDEIYAKKILKCDFLLITNA